MGRRAVIAFFQGQYRWLSNFWPAEVKLDGVIYPTVEHAYQAAKTINQAARLAIAAQPTPGMAKRAGKLLPIREDWDDIKLDLMEDLVQQKFQHEDLRAKLLATGDEELQEGNIWGDRFWGVCRGHGANHLGKLLMKIRTALKNELDESSSAV